MALHSVIPLFAIWSIIVGVPCILEWAGQKKVTIAPYVTVGAFFLIVGVVFTL